MMKRCLSLILSFALLLTLLPLSAIPQAKAESVAAEGFSDMGKLLAEAAQQDQAASPEEYPGGYALTDLTVTKKLATVEYAALEDATVMVAVYAEDGLQMLASGNAPALAAETSVQVELTGSVPTYFRVAAFLVRTGDLSPLCEPLESSRYTKDIQTLIKSTVSDYPEDRVINLDGDKKTNFMVMQEGTVQLQSSETANRLVSVDRENKRYVIENADASVAGLQPGDSFVHNVDGEDWIIAKVQSVTVDGTTVTIQGEDPKMEEVFSHVKIETEGTAADMQIDTTNMDENVTYLGIDGEESETPVRQTRGISGEGEDSIDILSFGFMIKVKTKVESGDTSVEVETGVKAKLGIIANYEFFYVNGKEYTDLKLDSGFFFDGSVEGKLNQDLYKIGQIMWRPIPGLSIGFEPTICMTLDGKIDLDVFVGTTTKYYYDENAGKYRTAAQNPQVEENPETKDLEVNTEIEVEGEFFIGLDLNPSVKIAEGLVAEAEATAVIGLFFTGDMIGTSTGQPNQLPEDKTAEPPEELHSCWACIDGEIHAGVKLGFKMEVFGVDLASSNELLWTFKLCDFYCCLDPTHLHNKMDYGTCPERLFLITAEVLDEWGEPVTGTALKANRVRMDGNLAYAKELGQTNHNGVVTCYIPAGWYSFYAEGMELPENSVIIAGAGKVRIDGNYLYYAQTNPGSALSPILEKIMEPGAEMASGICNGSVTWSMTTGGLLSIGGTGEVTEKPWENCGVSPRVVVIQEGITSVGEYLFNGESSIISISLPNSLRSIGVGAFAYTDISVVTIPEGVTKIEPGTFAYCSELASVTLPDSLQEIGKNAFTSCTGLDNVILPLGLKSVGAQAFSSCTAMQAVSIPNTVKTVGAYAFSGAGITRANLFDSVEQLEEGVFSSCASLKSVRLPGSLTKIPDYFFSGCKSLKSLQIPDTVTEYGDYAFGRCGFTEFTVPAHITQMGSNVFQGCPDLVSVEMLEEPEKPGITEIPGYCFDGCSSLAAVDIPDSVTTIGTAAFQNCKALRSIEIPVGVTAISSWTFKGCESLTDVKLHDKISQIGDRAFTACSSLTSIDLPNKLTEISGSVFQYSGLQSIEIPEGVEFVGDSAFWGCEQLQSVKFPSTLTGIAMFAFNDCTSLTSVSFPASLKVIPAYGFCDCTSLTTVELPEGVKQIGEDAFCGCKNLNNVDFPDSLEKINKSAFSGCDSLTSVYIPDGVTFVGNGAFIFCDSLSYVRIPASVTQMEYAAFSYCKNLSVAYFEGDAPEGNGWFYDNTMTVYYPEGNPTWTQEVMDAAEFEGELTWIPYTPGTVSVTAEKQAPATRKVIGGEYTQEEVEGKTLRTASFEDLTPGQSYLLLAVVNAEADPLLDPGNLLYVTQVTADANGKVTQRYIQRTETELSFVMLCGAAEQDLKDATVNFPAMTAGEEEKAVCPVVEYNGKQLVEGMDYRIEGQASYIKPGTYTCIIRGMNNYIGFVECTYTVTDCIPGDLNGDGLVTDADAVYLLRHTLFPAKYPVTQDADFNGDGLVIDSDAVYLLRHTLFPGSYPLH